MSNHQNGNSQTTLEAGRREHRQAAQMVADLAASQVRHAVELGRHAANMGMDHTENPFVDELPNKGLADAWASGWVMGTFRESA